MVFKQSFKYLKNKKIDFIKVILKLQYLLYLNIYIFCYYYILYICRAITTQKNPKSVTVKKSTIYIISKPSNTWDYSPSRNSYNQLSYYDSVRVCTRPDGDIY